MPFNRTILELKLKGTETFKKTIEAFNRTILELKFDQLPSGSF